jgi:beta-glucosidase
MSEDPLLISKMLVPYIKGVQDQEISACVKHFLANNQETERKRINVIMSDRALREIYLPGFKAAVQEGKVNTLMGAYNKFRGQYCSENDYLLNKLLKEELGFDGVVISDWAAVHNTGEALLNGLDLEMGTDLDMHTDHPDFHKFYLGDTVISLVRSGKVSESVVDEKVRRILRIMFRTKMFAQRSPGSFSTKEHQLTALKIAEEAIVLLKNDHMLPLQKGSLKSIAVIGDNATRMHSEGGGSSQVRTKYEITPLQGLKNLTGNGVKISYSQGYKVTREQIIDRQMIDEAVKSASNAEVAIVVGGWNHGFSNVRGNNAFDSEGKDKPNLILPFGQDSLIEAVINANPNTIVVLMGGGPAEISKWEGKAKAIIQAWYPGMEGGNALAKIILGEVNPSGKLPMTFPKKLADCPTQVIGEYPGENLTEQYKEGIFVGYRYFDTYKVEPQYCFGHGLSYTSFSFENLTIKPGNHHNAVVRLRIINTGKMYGAEVVQVYVKEEKTAVERPEKELKAFQKVFLQAGEKKEIEFTLTDNAFQYFDEGKGRFVLNPGKFKILVGSSSRDIRLSGGVEVN